MSILQFKESNCKNCYKCIRNCPIKAIEVKNHQAQIIEQDCILCGTCTLVCPQNAKRVRNDVHIVKQLIRDGKKVIANVAPSFIADYDVKSFEEFRSILISLGFSEAYETARGAFVVKSRYEELIESGWNKTIISSCCPTVINLIEKHYPDLIRYLAPVLSPMQVNAALIKEENPAAVIVFLGPCISKKEECERNPGLTDYVLTFDELNQWIDESDQELPTQTTPSDSPKYLSRFFPTAGGIIKTMKQNPNFRYICVDELESCISALKEIGEGNLENCFIEMSSCKGSCVGGPSMGKHRRPVLSANMKVIDFAQDKKKRTDFVVSSGIQTKKEFHNRQILIEPPSQAEIAAILKKLGKTSIEDELNCGTCGYATCRDKAIAIYFHKAEISMCLPFMQQRAESLADKIISATPNAIITVDPDLNIKQINGAACAIFGIADPKDIIGSPISRIMDEFEFAEVFSSEKHITRHKAYLAEYHKFLEQTFLFDKNNEIVICIMRDITSSELEKERIRAAKSNAVSLTDKILEKQLNIVHEIASLLGETAAETKVALNELKNTVLMEKEDES